MSERPSSSLEDRLAERLTRLGTVATITSLAVLSAVVFGNALIHLVKVAANALLVLILNRGPVAAALLSGISTGVTYYGWSRIVRRRDKLNVREEAKGQALDQAGNGLQSLAGRGCASRLSLGIFGTALLCCVLTYAPAPLRVLGATVSSTSPATLSSTAPIHPTNTPVHQLPAG